MTARADRGAIWAAARDVVLEVVERIEQRRARAGTCTATADGKRCAEHDVDAVWGAVWACPVSKRALSYRADKEPPPTAAELLEDLDEAIGLLGAARVELVREARAEDAARMASR